MEILSQTLSLLSLQGRLYFRAELGTPWAVEIPPERQVIRFHLVTVGSCWLWQPSIGWVELYARDFVLVTGEDAHILASDTDTAPVPLPQVLASGALSDEGVLRVAGDGQARQTGLVCGHFALDAPSHHALVSHLPKQMLLRGTDPASGSWLSEAIRLVTTEVNAQQPGSAAVIDRLSEVLFVYALRANANHPGAQHGLLPALKHPKIHKALSAMHGDPPDNWTLPRLARIAGMSRSSFAAAFKDIVARSPLGYLSDLRLDLARQILTQPHPPTLAVISETVGYHSEPAFSRAFKKRFGQAPGRYRLRSMDLC